MGSLVQLEFIVTRETPSANHALERSLPRMGAGVNFQPVVSRKGLPTDVALKRLAARVGQLVDLEFVLLSERHLAQRASVRSLTGVSAFMVAQLVALRERLAAKDAREVFPLLWRHLMFLR